MPQTPCNTRTTEELARIIARRTSFSAPDIIGAVYAVAEAIAAELRDGNAVTLYPLGRFHPRGRFTPGTVIKQALDNNKPIIRKKH